MAFVCARVVFRAQNTFFYVRVVLHVENDFLCHPLIVALSLKYYVGQSPSQMPICSTSPVILPLLFCIQMWLLPIRPLNLSCGSVASCFVPFSFSYMSNISFKKQVTYPWQPYTHLLNFDWLSRYDLSFALNRCLSVFMEILEPAFSLCKLFIRHTDPFTSLAVSCCT